jgi:hypothetical protein
MVSDASATIVPVNGPPTARKSAAARALRDAAERVPRATEVGRAGRPEGRARR